MINLVRLGPTDFSSSYLEWIFSGYFNILDYDISHAYTKDTLFVFSRPNNYSELILPKLLEQGYKIVIANPWEARPYLLANEYKDYQDQILVILGCSDPFYYGWKNVVAVPRWFWFNEHLWYTCDQRISKEIANYIPQRKNNKLFLMPIKRSKKFRDRVVEKFNDQLDHAVWSYVEQWPIGTSLPRYTWSAFERIQPDRIMEPLWYDQTYFTVVVETAVNRLQDITKEISGQRSEDYPCNTFVTEKTFKPIAFRHPFMVVGMPGTLDFLRQNGFETYENLFDESYDLIMDFEERLDVIYSNIKNFSESKYLEPITEQKINHNYHRFNDRSLVLEYFKQDIINPMLEFFDAT